MSALTIGFEVTADALEQSAGGIALKRSGFQRYRSVWKNADGEEQKIWIGGEHRVQPGSYDGNARQRRKMTWTVKIDGEEVGEADTLKEAKALAEAELGIVPSPTAPAAGPGVAADGAGAGVIDPVQVLAPPTDGPDPFALLRVQAFNLVAGPPPAAPPEKAYSLAPKMFERAFTPAGPVSADGSRPYRAVEPIGLGTGAKGVRSVGAGEVVQVTGPDETGFYSVTPPSKDQPAAPTTPAQPARPTAPTAPKKSPADIRGAPMTFGRDNPARNAPPVMRSGPAKPAPPLARPAPLAKPQSPAAPAPSAWSRLNPFGPRRSYLELVAKDVDPPLEVSQQDLDQLDYESLVPPREFKPSTPWHLKPLPDGRVVDQWTGKTVPRNRNPFLKAPPAVGNLRGEEQREQMEEKLYPMLTPEQQRQVDEVRKQRNIRKERPADAYKAERPIPPKSTGTLDTLGLRKDGGYANIITVLQRARRDQVDYWREWYKYARDDAKAIASRDWGQGPVPESLAAALIAILSPNTKWEDNVFAAEQMLRGQGKKVIDYRQNLSQQALENFAVKIFPDLYANKETLGVMAYLTNIMKAQRLIDAYQAGGSKDSFEVDVAQPERLEWTPNDPRDTKRASERYQQLVERGWTPRTTKVVLDDKPKKMPPSKGDKSGKERIRQPTMGYVHGWAQDKTIPFGAPFPAGEGRLVMNPPFKASAVPKSGKNKGVAKSPPKVTAFYESIMKPEERQDTVVLDGHAINIWRGEPRMLADLKKNQPNDTTRERMIADYKKAAANSKAALAQVGVQIPSNLTPQQVQAVTWTVWRDMLTNSGRRTNENEPDEDDEGAAADDEAGMNVDARVRPRVLTAQAAGGGGFVVQAWEVTGALSPWQLSQLEKEWMVGRTPEQALEEVEDFIRFRGPVPDIIEVRNRLRKQLGLGPPPVPKPPRRETPGQRQRNRDIWLDEAEYLREQTPGRSLPYSHGADGEGVKYGGRAREDSTA